MSGHVNELDRMIDALNADREPDETGPVDADLMELFDLARGLRELRHMQWPDDTFPIRAAINLSSKLGSTSGNLVESAEFTDKEHARPLQLPALPVHGDVQRSIALPKRNPWIRKSLEIAASIVVLIAFAGLVSLLLRGGSSGSPTSTAQLGQSAGAGSIAALNDVFPVVRSVDDAGNGRHLHMAKSDAGYTVTLDWTGSTSGHVLVAMTIERQRGEYGDIRPYQMTMQTNGTTLPEVSVMCKQPVCLAQFDRTPVDGRTGDIPLHLEISGLITGANAATPGVGTTQAVDVPHVAASFAFDFSNPAWSNVEGTATDIVTPTVTLKTKDQATVLETVSSPVLSALQQAAGFGLYVPTELPSGLTLEQPNPPMSLPGFTSVVLKYVDADGNETLTITEASPYQDSAQTMPADIWNNAKSVDIGSVGYGTVSARIYQSDGDVQLWWQVGPTSIRLESGGSAGTTMLTENQLLDIALWMMPVSTSANATPEIPPDAMIQTSDQAIAKVRAVISSLGGNLQTSASKVSLVPLSQEVALGIPEPIPPVDPSAPVWVVQFDDGLSPQECPENWVSVCNGGQLVVVVDATSGEIFGFHGQTGAWQ